MPDVLTSDRISKMAFRFRVQSLVTIALLMAFSSDGLTATLNASWIEGRSAAAVSAMPRTGEDLARHDEEVRVAQGSCSAAAAQAAAQTGGQVLSVTTSQQGGRTVCIVTVLIPGRDGSRPRRTTVTIPQ